MKALTKRTLVCALALATLFAVGITAMAATDDIDEAEIYLGEMETAAPAAAPTKSGSANRRVEGTSTSNIANSPAVVGDGIQVTNPVDDEEDGELTTINSPDTGAPSMMFAVGTALLALGCIPLTLRKKRK